MEPLPFEIPSNILTAWREFGEKGVELEKNWRNEVDKSDAKIQQQLTNPENLNIQELDNLIFQEKERNFNEKPELATRQCSMKVIEILKKNFTQLIGGSADLWPNNTKTSNSEVINSKSFKGNYIHYGVREHGMASIMNGLALYHNVIPYGGTFLIFSDYCKPSIRLSALMGLRVIYIFSHDSIGLGEDGPTHQPVEQLSGLRAIPNLKVFRPADINETLESWQLALKNFSGPSAIILSRQKLPYITRKISKENNCAFGAYEVNITSHDNKVTLLASGSEVSIALEVQNNLKNAGIESKVVSMPCQELFDEQNDKYKEKIIEQDNLIVSIEAGSISCWGKYTKKNDLRIGIDNFGKSAPFKELYNDFNISSSKIVSLIQKKLLK